jgi:hypothetical protein
MLCAAGASAGTPAPAAYTSEGGYFSITLPSGWSKVPPGGAPASAKKIYGLDLLGPRSGAAPAPSITVKFYAGGNSLFKTANDYVELNSKPFGKPAEGEQYSAVTGAALAGRKAFRFERKYTEYNKPRTVPPETTVMFERHVVLPARDGFYVLLFSAPFADAKALLPQFDAVLKSFKPANPRK